MTERAIQAAIVRVDMWLEQYGMISILITAILLAVIIFIVKEEIKMGVTRRYEIESEDTTNKTKDYSLTTDENGNIVEVKPEEVMENAGNNQA